MEMETDNKIKSGRWESFILNKMVEISITDTHTPMNT